MVSLRDKLAMEIGFAGRDRNDVSDDPEDFWLHSGEAWRSKFHRQADAVLKLLEYKIGQVEWLGGGEYHYVAGDHCVVMWSDDACRWIADCWFTNSIGGWDSPEEAKRAVEKMRASKILAMMGAK